MNQYEQAAFEVEQAFKKNGASVQLKVITPSELNPVTGEEINGGEIITTDTNAMFSVITDTLARSLKGYENGDRLLKLPASVTPRPGDYIVYHEQEFRIIDVLPLEPGGIPIMYTVQARR